MGFDSFEKVSDFMVKCKTCGEEVSTGIGNISGHWVNCTGKSFTEALISHAKEEGKIRESEIEKLKKLKLETIVKIEIISDGLVAGKTFNNVEDAAEYLVVNHLDYDGTKEFFGRFCTSCGDNDPNCRCWDDS